MDKILWHKQAYTMPSSKDTMYCPTFRYYKNSSAYDCPTGTIQHILERGTVNDYERIIPIAFPVDIHDGSIVCFYNIENAKIVFHSDMFVLPSCFLDSRSDETKLDVFFGQIFLVHDS